MFYANNNQVDWNPLRLPSLFDKRFCLVLQHDSYNLTHIFGRIQFKAKKKKKSQQFSRVASSSFVFYFWPLQMYCMRNLHSMKRLNTQKKIHFLKLKE